MKHFGREALLMLKSTPVKVPAADVAGLVPSFTTTETVQHRVTPQTFRCQSKSAWHKHIFAKRTQLGTNLTKMYRLLERKSKLSASNKLLAYKTILTPIWPYGIKLWSKASTSNIGILERFQSKALRMIMDAPWYVPNTVIRKDLQTPTIKEEIHSYSSPQRTPERPNSEPRGATRKQTFVKAPAK
jgi:hypothetical protein